MDEFISRAITPTLYACRTRQLWKNRGESNHKKNRRFLYSLTDYGRDSKQVGSLGIYIRVGRLYFYINGLSLL